MVGPAQAPRRYDSSGRQAAAAESRRRIVRAASDLFVEHGWAGTTVAAVAEAAGVSAPTVFAGFGSKVLLLKAAIDVALAGDDRAVPVSERPTLIPSSPPSWPTSSSSACEPLPGWPPPSSSEAACRQGARSTRLGTSSGCATP